jgi:hypothetical protein
MSQDDRTPTFPHRHAARFGFPFPPLAGGDPEGEPTDPEGGQGEGTPSPEAQLGIDPPALPFAIDDAPESLSRADAVAWLRAREAQMQSGFQKSVNAALEARKRAESALSLQDRLASEESRRQAITELLQPYGLEPEWDDDDDEDVDDDDLPLIDDTDLEAGTDPELLDRLERVEQRFERDDNAAVESRWKAHVTSALSEFAAREKIEGGAEAIPKPVRDTILGHALQAPRIDVNGEPQLDVAAGVAAYDETVGLIAQRTRAGYLGSKDTPEIALGGGSADPHQDLSTRDARLKAANLIAQRHGR